jgi:hypothetical protein
MVISVVGIALMYVVKATRTLRVARDGELAGLDIHEHGTPAYHMEPGLGTTVVTLDLSEMDVDDPFAPTDAPSPLVR